MSSMTSRGLDMLIRVLRANGDPVTGVVEHRPNPESEKDDYGQLIPDWKVFGTIDVVSVQPFGSTSGSLEAEVALQVSAQVTQVLVCPYVAGVTSSMRVKIRDKTLYVSLVHNVKGLDKLLYLYCGETVPE